MSEKEHRNTEDKIKRMVDESRPEWQFGYRPPMMKAKTETTKDTKKDTEERGYVPPKKPRPPSGSDSKKGGDK